MTQTIQFYGDCRPKVAGKQIAISYRYWNDITSDPNGVDENCTAPLEWSVEQNKCVCPDDCGGNNPNITGPKASGLTKAVTGDAYYCDSKTCQWTCTADCGGCPANYQCDTTSCSCSCVEDVTCNVGYKFDKEGCTCACDVEALSANIPEGYQVDADSTGSTRTASPSTQIPTSVTRTATACWTASSLGARHLRILPAAA